MSNAPVLNRRYYMLLTLAMAGSWVAGARLGVVVRERVGSESQLRSKLTAIFLHQESARAIGQAYLQDYPGEADLQALQERIAQAVAGGYQALAAASPQEVSDLISEQIRQEFAVEHMVKVQGLLLSITEARLCALSSLV